MEHGDTVRAHAVPTLPAQDGSHADDVLAAANALAALFRPVSVATHNLAATAAAAALVAAPSMSYRSAPFDAPAPAPGTTAVPWPAEQGFGVDHATLASIMLIRASMALPAGSHLWLASLGAVPCSRCANLWCTPNTTWPMALPVCAACRCAELVCATNALASVPFSGQPHTPALSVPHAPWSLPAAPLLPVADPQSAPPRVQAIRPDCRQPESFQQGQHAPAMASGRERKRPREKAPNDPHSPEPAAVLDGRLPKRRARSAPTLPSCDPPGNADALHVLAQTVGHNGPASDTPRDSCHPRTSAPEPAKPGSAGPRVTDGSAAGAAVEGDGFYRRGPDRGCAPHEGGECFGSRRVSLDDLVLPLPASPSCGLDLPPVGALFANSCIDWPADNDAACANRGGQTRCREECHRDSIVEDANLGEETDDEAQCDATSAVEMSHADGVGAATCAKRPQLGDATSRCNDTERVPVIDLTDSDECAGESAAKERPQGQLAHMSQVQPCQTDDEPPRLFGPDAEEPFALPSRTAGDEEQPPPGLRLAPHGGVNNAISPNGSAGNVDFGTDGNAGPAAEAQAETPNNDTRLFYSYPVMPERGRQSWVVFFDTTHHQAADHELVLCRQVAAAAHLRKPEYAKLKTKEAIALQQQHPISSACPHLQPRLRLTPNLEQSWSLASPWSGALASVGGDGDCNDTRARAMYQHKWCFDMPSDTFSGEVFTVLLVSRSRGTAVELGPCSLVSTTSQRAGRKSRILELARGAERKAMVCNFLMHPPSARHYANGKGKRQGARADNAMRFRLAELGSAARLPSTPFQLSTALSECQAAREQQ